MTISQNQQEAAFEEVLDALENSIAYLNDSALSVHDPLIYNVLHRLASLRSSWCQIYRQDGARRDQHHISHRNTDFVEVVDRETTTMQESEICDNDHDLENISLLNILFERIVDEKSLLDTIEETLRFDWDSNRSTTLENLAAHVRRSIAHLLEICSNLNGVKINTN